MNIWIHFGRSRFSAGGEGTAKGRGSAAAKDQEHLQGDLSIVFICLKEAFRGQEQKIREEIRRQRTESLPEYELPVDYLFLNEMPLTGIGKINFRALEQKAADQ